MRLSILGLLLVLSSNLLAQHEPRRERSVRIEFVNFVATPRNDLVLEVRGIDGDMTGPVQAMGDGRFEFRGEEGKTYELTVTNEQHEFVERHVVSVSGGSQPLVIFLRSTGQTSTVASTQPISVRQMLIPSKAAKELKRAENAFREGDTRASIEHLERAIQIHPRFLEAHNNLGTRYIQLGQYEKAVEELQKAIAIDPQIANPHQNLGVALAMLRRYPEAETAARRAIELDPNSVQSRYLLGRVLAAEEKNTLEVVDLLRQAASKFPNARLFLASALLKQGATDQAIAELRTYLRSPQPGKKQEVECLLAQLTHAPGTESCGQPGPRP